MSKYTRKTKLAIAQRYLQGESSHALSHQTKIPSRQIRYWGQVYRLHGDQSFLKKEVPYTSAQKYHILLKMVTERWSLGYTSAYYNLASPGILSTWRKLFLTHGLSGLNRKQGRPSMSQNKTNTNKSANSSKEPTIEELKEELNYLRAENAYLKKLDALLAEKETRKKQG